jgi:chromosome segregation ATPase
VPSQPEGTDPFDQLEERIQRAVAVTTELRAENARLRQDIEGLEIRAAEAESANEETTRMRTSIERLEAEVSSMQKEREKVRTRVERLLQQIDSLSSL